MCEKKTMTLQEALGGNAYPGRGILLGKAGGKAVTAYFIMGRSENSRNRLFRMNEGILRTEPYDEKKVKDPSLIIYNALRTFEDRLIVTNGDQTDTVYEALKEGKSFRDALNTRTFEPDAPNYTPRISGLVTFSEGEFSYQLSILKSSKSRVINAVREYYSYVSAEGIGHLIHTYETDGDPLPSFQGAPKTVTLPDDLLALADELWENLDPANKISLYVRMTDPVTGEIEDVIRNKYQK